MATTTSTNTSTSSTRSTSSNRNTSTTITSSTNNTSISRTKVYNNRSFALFLSTISTISTIRTTSTTSISRTKVSLCLCRWTDPTRSFSPGTLRPGIDHHQHEREEHEEGHQVRHACQYVDWIHSSC